MSITFIALSYFTLFVFIMGFARKIYIFASTPAPLKIPLTPAPGNRLGVIRRMAGEALFFTSLYRGGKWIWVGGYIFHLAFAVVIFRHLKYFITLDKQLVELLGYTEIWAGVILVVATGYLFIRRIADERVRYISTGADYLWLLLIGLIACSGLMMQLVDRVDVLSVKAFVIGIVTFSPVEMPDDSLFIAHLSLVLLFMVYLPFSKLMHMGGLFFSPTRYQMDDERY